MSFQLCTSGAATIKAGVNVNSDLLSNATALDKFSDEVEGTIAMKTRTDWSGAYATTGVMIKGTLSDLASDLVAIKMINHDTTGYIKGEAALMLDVLTTNSDMIIADLREEQNQELNR